MECSAEFFFIMNVEELASPSSIVAAFARARAMEASELEQPDSNQSPEDVNVDAPKEGDHHGDEAIQTSRKRSLQ
ncbi:hypothetical protein BASA82_000074 [Batrachochytrium salamandrivorans]|nr:hypothetical protein BASA82_000074 [Batrachochytrium salamandrivorans]